MFIDLPIPRPLAHPSDAWLRVRFQRHSWRMANEMAVGMTAPIVVCVALVRPGLCPLVPFLTWLSAANVYAVAHDAMLLGMIAVMVYRRGIHCCRA